MIESTRFNRLSQTHQCDYVWKQTFRIHAYFEEEELCARKNSQPVPSCFLLCFALENSLDIKILKTAARFKFLIQMKKELLRIFIVAKLY